MAMKTGVWVLGVALLACSAANAETAQNPIGGALQNFFSAEPGGALPAQPGQFGGGECDAVVGRLAAAGRVWWGRFSGGREMNSNFGRASSYDTHEAEGCFPSRAACERWMYALKSQYGDQPRFNQCRLGYEPGAPVPPWWAPGQ